MSSPTPHLQAADHYRSQQESAERRLMEFLSIPSVSTDPAFAQEVRRGAAWVADYLRELGLQVETLSIGGGHPAVIARTPDALVANPQASGVLFYGHYDVQPPDPLDGWTSPPFEPQIRETAQGRAVYARGASDDKGQVLSFLEALRAYREAGLPWPGPVTVLIEGEEECGSVTLPRLLNEYTDLLRADICLVSDTCMWEGGPQPRCAITYGLRGLVYFDIKLYGPARDLHSGVYGGTLANPATMLARVLGRLWDDQGRITLPGFYDDVLPLAPQERSAWDALGFDEKQFTRAVGSQPFGEEGFTTLERRWVRPACDINGLYGGYMGEGAKTVIPTFAGAKVSFRIPAAMDPRKVADQFTAWLKAQPTGGCRWQISEHGAAHPVATATNSPFVTAATRALTELTGEAPVLVREGATIPVISDLKTRLGVETLLIGFGLNSDNIHSPDEHLGLDRFHLGARAHTVLLHELAQVRRKEGEKRLPESSA